MDCAVSESTRILPNFICSAVEGLKSLITSGEETKALVSISENETRQRISAIYAG